MKTGESSSLQCQDQARLNEQWVVCNRSRFAAHEGESPTSAVPVLVLATAVLLREWVEGPPGPRPTTSVKFSTKLCIFS